MDDIAPDCCWVCLCGLEETGKPLVQCCKCPRPVHRECLARWQLQKAGQREERYCRFCFEEFPDWRNSLTPRDLKPTTPIMAVSVKGKIHKLRVKPGPEGKEDFKRQVRQLLGYTEDMEFDVIFECKTPHNGEKVQLHGFSAFDAATHCAAVSAAKRLENKPPKPAHSALPSSSVHRSSQAVCSDSTGRASAVSTPRQEHSSRIGSFGQSSNTGVGSFSRPAASAQVEAQYHVLTRQQELHLQQHNVHQPTGLPVSSDAHTATQVLHGGTRTAGWQSMGYSDAPWNHAVQQHVPLASPPGRSVSSSSADASAMLTAAGTSGSGAASAGGGGDSFGATAVATAALMSCPLVLQPCESDSSTNVTDAVAPATDDRLWTNCDVVSEPLPVLDTQDSSIAVGSAPLDRGVAELAVGSVGCLGRLSSAAPSDNMDSKLSTSKLAAWLKRLGVKTGDGP